MTILLKYTKLGYQIDVLGESETTARYAGMNTLKIMIIAVLLSGGLDSSVISAITKKFAARRVEDQERSEAWWPAGLDSRR